MYNMKSDNISGMNAYPYQIICAIAEDIDDEAQAKQFSKLLSKTNYYPVLKLRNNYIACILGRWCVWNTKSKLEECKVSTIDLSYINKMCKITGIETDTEMRKFKRDIILSALFENLDVGCRFDFTDAEKIDLYKFMVLTAVEYSYISDGLSFAEFSFDEFYSSLKIYYAANIVHDRNHYVYEYLKPNAKGTAFVLSIKGSRIMIAGKDRCYVYTLPDRFNTELVMLHKIDYEIIYSIIKTIFNIAYNCEYTYLDLDFDYMHIITENEQMVKSGIEGYYVRLYKAAHAYQYKQKDSDIYPV